MSIEVLYPLPFPPEKIKHCENKPDSSIGLLFPASCVCLHWMANI